MLLLLLQQAALLLQLLRAARAIAAVLNPLCSKLLNPLLLRTCVFFLLQLLAWLFLCLFSMLSMVRSRRCTMLFAGIAFFGLRASTCSAALSARTRSGKLARSLACCPPDCASPCRCRAICAPGVEGGCHAVELTNAAVAQGFAACLLSVGFFFFLGPQLVSYRDMQWRAPRGGRTWLPADWMWHPYRVTSSEAAQNALTKRLLVLLYSQKCWNSEALESGAVSLVSISPAHSPLVRPPPGALPT